MSLTSTAIEQRSVTYFLAALLTLLGIGAFFSLGQLEDPEFSIKTAVILTPYPGASPEEVELEVTDRIELVLQELPQIDYVESWSRAGQSLVSVEVKSESGIAHVMGIGLNVNYRERDFPEEIREEATSLSLIAGRDFLRAEVLATLLGTLEEWFDRMAAGRIEEIADAWRPLSSLLGRRVRLQRGDRWITGTITDLSPVRGVCLRPDDGEPDWIPAEHVLFIRPEGVTGK